MKVSARIVGLSADNYRLLTDARIEHKTVMSRLPAIYLQSEYVEAGGAYELRREHC